MKVLSVRYLFLFALISAMAISCDDIVTYNDGYDDGLTSIGVPVITKVSTITSRESEITGANLDQMIIIQGKNLSNVKSIRFNDVEVDLKNVYVKSNEIVVPVPRQLPTNVIDKLVVVTSRGEVSVDFKVTIPPVIIGGAYNEFAAPGDTLVLMGENFDLYKIDKQNGKVVIGDIPAQITEASENLLKIKIPENAIPDSKVAITSSAVATPLEFKWMHSGLTMLNYNNLSENGIWAGEKFVTDGKNIGDPKPLLINVKFSRVVLNASKDSWNNIFGGGLNMSDADIIAHPEDFLFKFEINTKTTKPLSIGNIIFRLGSGEYRWNPTSGVSFNTYNKWKTVEFSLKTILGDKVLAKGWTAFEVIYQPTSNLDCDFSLANFRIVRK